MEEFVEKLLEIGYKYVLPMKVNGYRKERIYFSAESPEGEKVFIKWLRKNTMLEKKEISYEKQIGRILGGKEYPLPTEYIETTVVSKFIDSIGDIKYAIKKESVDNALCYIQNSIEKYINLLDLLNRQEVNCYCYGYLKMIDIYIKRWAYYSKKPKYRKQMAYFVFIFYTRIKRLTYKERILPVKYIILGDLNPGNFLCLSDKSVKCIDYEKVCCSDPNVDMASYIVKIRHHARNNPQLIQGIDSTVNIFKKSKYYKENNYKFAYDIFDYIDKNWS